MTFMDKLYIRRERISEPVRGIQPKISGIFMKQGVFGVYFLRMVLGRMVLNEKEEKKKFYNFLVLVSLLMLLEEK